MVRSQQQRSFFRRLNRGRYRVAEPLLLSTISLRIEFSCLLSSRNTRDRNSVVLFVVNFPVLGGATMQIDLDSWELGYADGQFGRPLQCPANLDCFSYSSGYREGRAYLAGTHTDQVVHRYARSSHR